MSGMNNALPQEHFPIPGEEPITVELDTGRKVEMVIAELEMLYEAGDIPDELTAIAARQLFPPANENQSGREKRYWEQFKLAKHVVTKVLRNPIVVATPMKAGEIAINHLYRDEIWQIYRLANDPALALENFRRQQTGDVVAAQEGEGVRSITEPVAANTE
jgi:hypothetical protein